ncbi:MAG: tol-pal system protein YbgF [Nitrospirota bacterium]
MKRLLWIMLVGFSPAFFMGGCALQSSLVTLEQSLQEEVEKGQQRESDFLALRTKVESLPKEIKTDKKPLEVNQKGVANLLAEVNTVKTQLRLLEGRIEEEGRKASEAMRSADDQDHIVKTFSSRLSALEKKMPIGVATSTEIESVEGVVEMPSILPTEAYTLAYNDYLRGNYDLSIMSFKNYIEQYPNATSIPQALYWIGQSYYNKVAYAEAISAFEQMETRFPKHDLVPNAMLKRGVSLIELSKKDLAKAVLQGVIEKYPQSSEAHLAKDKLATLQ